MKIKYIFLKHLCALLITPPPQCGHPLLIVPYTILPSYLPFNWNTPWQAHGWPNKTQAVQLSALRGKEGEAAKTMVLPQLLSLQLLLLSSTLGEDSTDLCSDDAVFKSFVCPKVNVVSDGMIQQIWELECAYSKSLLKVEGMVHSACCISLLQLVLNVC